MKAQNGFERFSVTKALKSHNGHGLVARSARFEVWSEKCRLGLKGDRYTMVTFAVLEVTRGAVPRVSKDFRMPDTHRSDLAKILAYLEALEKSTAP
jgi:hypothetical protein